MDCDMGRVYQTASESSANLDNMNMWSGEGLRILSHLIQLQGCIKTVCIIHVHSYVYIPE